MSKLIINENPLMILPSLAAVIGLNEAIILQQVHYWLDPRINKNQINGSYWVYNTYNQWAKQFPFWSEITIRRTIKNLEKSKLLISEDYNKNSYLRLKWYTINYKELAKIENKSIPNKERSDQFDQTKSLSISQIDQTDRSNRSTDAIKLIRSYKETETTTETTTKNSLSPSSTSKTKDISEEYEREKEMICIWDKEIREGEKASIQSKTRLIALKKVIEESFEGNLDNWKTYCQNIKKCNFLMGGGANHWKADLTWATKQENLIRVLEGYYHQKEEKAIENNINETILEEKENISADPTWNIVKEKLKINKGEATYRSWFRKLDFKGYDNNRILLVAPSKFIKDWILEKFSNDIIGLFKETEINIKDIEIFVETEGGSLI